MANRRHRDGRSRKHNKGRPRCVHKLEKRRQCAKMLETECQESIKAFQENTDGRR